MDDNGDSNEAINDDNMEEEIYAEEVGLDFAGEGETSDDLTSNSTGPEPVTVYRLIKLEDAEALGISLQEGSVTLPNQKTKIITRNIIKLKKTPNKLVLAQKKASNTTHYNVRLDNGNKDDPMIIEDPLTYNSRQRFVCQICRKGFRHASHLKRHINSHTGERLYDCKTCGKRFLDASTLCRHRRIHAGDRPYSCKICQKNFGTLGSLRRHITVHNQASRPFCCSICGKRFPDNSSYQKHWLIHTGIRPFPCDMCNKSFVHIGDLNGHKKIHDEVKPWKCDRCDKEFSKQSNCARHSRIHEGDKEFMCHLCGVGYNYQSSLTRHLLTHRKRENTNRRGNRNVVILTEIEGNDCQPKLTLRQIKYLVRKNKINFGDGDDDESVRNEQQIQVANAVEDENEEDVYEEDVYEEEEEDDDNEFENDEDEIEADDSEDVDDDLEECQSYTINESDLTKNKEIVIKKTTNTSGDKQKFENIF